MMRPLPKPDSSYASNRLTRTYRPRRHLLSSFNKSDDDIAPLSEGEDESIPRKSRNEPGTDDEPLSSSDSEPSDDGEAPSLAEENQRKTLEEKLADGDRDMQSSPAPGFGSSPRKAGLVRTSSAIDDDDDARQWDGFTSFSQSSKRTKMTYPSRNNPGSYSRTPTSSARSAATPDKKSQRSQTSAKQKKDAGGDKASGELEEESGFKMPIEIPSSQKPPPEKSGFKMPPSFTMNSTSNSSLGTESSKNPQLMLIDDDESNSPLSTPPSSPASPFMDDEPQDSQPKSNSRMKSPPHTARCPMCKAEVDPAMLIRFEAQPKQRIREQQQFCASHQQDTADKEWSAQGYPEINWDKLDERVQKYFPDIEKLLAPECNSYYRNILVTSHQSGQSKNFRLTLSGDGLETISCGYYGTRGSQKMLEAIMDRFSMKMSRLAKFDPIIQKAGPAVYAQSVLVPELAVRLVKEDMDVDDDAARQILRDSINLGEKVNPALDDVVPIPEEAET